LSQHHLTHQPRCPQYLDFQQRQRSLQKAQKKGQNHKRRVPNQIQEKAVLLEGLEQAQVLALGPVLV
jgi:hypothetical protein